MEFVSTGGREPQRWARGNAGAGGRPMTSIERWHTSWRWAVAVGWLVCSVMDVSAQDGRWERVTAMGVQAFAQGDYAEAVRQFQAALPLAEVGSLAPRFMKLAAGYEAQGQYTDAALV